MCDIDHFKHVNDTCGHAAGDLVIQGLAKESTRIVGKLCHSRSLCQRAPPSRYNRLADVPMT
ncbi:diguanylate cyclase domain-containing protein [Rhizobium sp. BK661]|uniref:diguanylate cyclase domain-containing protein n=1 Tax=Rhizobium sp. BK661 TaxID=2586991 RepID=UPI00386DE2F6